MAPPVKIYTDGSSLGNPGPGGWAAVLIHGNKRKELSGGFSITTNNRMEILAAIMAIRALKKPELKAVIHTDSKLLVDAVNKKWLANWQKKNWMKSNKTRVLNIDLWSQLNELLKTRDVEFVWVKGHAGIEENERCDILCKEAASGYGLPKDEGYLQDYKPDQDSFITDSIDSEIVPKKDKHEFNSEDNICCEYYSTIEGDEVVIRDSNKRKKLSIHRSELQDFINKLNELL